SRPEGMAQPPAAVIQPGTLVRCVLRLQTEQVANRALQTDRRGMRLPDGRKMTLWTRQRHDGHPCSVFVQKCHVNGTRIAPKPRQRPTGYPELLGNGLPDRLIDYRTPPWPMVLHLVTGADNVVQCQCVWHRLAQHLRNVLEPGDDHWWQIDSSPQNQCQMREDRQI